MSFSPLVYLLECFTWIRNDFFGFFLIFSDWNVYSLTFLSLNDLWSDFFLGIFISKSIGDGFGNIRKLELW